MEQEEGEPEPKKMKSDESYSKKLLYVELAQLGSVMEEEKKCLVREEVEGQQELQKLIDGDKLAREDLVKNQTEAFIRLEEKQKSQLEEMIQKVKADQQLEREKLKACQKEDLAEREKVLKDKINKIATRTLPLREKLEAREQTLQNVESRLFSILQKEKIRFELKCEGCAQSFRDKMIFMCLEGLHNICSDCKPRLKTCRDCTGDTTGYLARNRSMEEQIKMMSE